MSEKKSRSIFRVLLSPLLGILAGEVVLMLAILLFGGVFQQLRTNMEEILQGHVANRSNYLLAEMIGNWSELDTLAEDVNQCVQARLDSGMTLAQLCGDSELYTPLLSDTAQLLIDEMYNKQVSGAFVVLAGSETLHNGRITFPGLYFRDRDPQAHSTRKQEDILAQRAPHGVIQMGRLATDAGWTTLFSREDCLEQDFFKPYYAALEAETIEDAKYYGYWTSTPYTLAGSSHTAISYSIPLVLEDGTVYGVLGVELLTEYVESLLPREELHSSGEGAYLLAVSQDGSQQLDSVVLSGSTSEDTFIINENGQQATSGCGSCYAAAVPLTLYSRNAPFEGEQWYLLGSVPESALYAFVNRLIQLCILAAAATLVFGVLGTLLVSYRLSKPIGALSREVIQARQDNQIPHLSQIWVREIDQLVEAVIQLSREVLESSTRFLSIMDMASVDLGGFELKEGTNAVYVTKNYFPLLGREDVDEETLSQEEFLRLRKQLREELEYSVEEDGSLIYTVPLKGGGVRYVRAEQKQLENRSIGLIEDVTSSVRERKKVESERDYDPLTGLLSRQGFWREARRLFHSEGAVENAALLMLDLDKLKAVNDTFGHSAGDSYIITAGNCFRENASKGALCARISGDEFLILYHSFQDKAQIRQQVSQLFRQIHSLTFLLPDGSDHGISASGGVAWYPDSSKDLSELVRYADFAMYCAKKAKRGTVTEFDRAAYDEMERQHQCQQEFYRVLEQKQLHFHFQPIFDARTGRPFAYEALMRIQLPDLNSPLTVLELARKTDRLQEVETLAIFGASEAYEALLAQKVVPEEAMLFINSIADTSMTNEDESRYHQRFTHLQKRVVIELAESETINLDLAKKKQAVKGFSGMLALDDYGSGYYTERNLLELNPSFIKLDIAVIRSIHRDEKRQELVKNVVAYAHSRGMRIVAEGLESAEEVEKSLELGVDLLQGYYLSKPEDVPQPISKEARALIQSYWKQRKSEE